MDSFADITGLVSLTDHLVGKCRIDVIDYVASPSYDDNTKMGTLEGTPSFNFGRDAADIIAGVPEGIIASYGIKDSGGFKATLQEYQIAKLGYNLGLGAGNFSSSGTTPVGKWNFGGNLGLRYFSARITGRLADGNYLVVTFHKGRFNPKYEQNMSAGPNFRDLEFVAMIDTTKDMGANVGSVEITTADPWAPA